MDGQTKQKKVTPSLIDRIANVIGGAVLVWIGLFVFALAAGSAFGAAVWMLKQFNVGP